MNTVTNITLPSMSEERAARELELVLPPAQYALLKYRANANAGLSGDTLPDHGLDPKQLYAAKQALIKKGCLLSNGLILGPTAMVALRNAPTNTEPGPVSTAANVRTEKRAILTSKGNPAPEPESKSSEKEDIMATTATKKAPAATKKAPAATKKADKPTAKKADKPTAKKAPAAESRGRAPVFSDEALITKIVENPKRESSACYVRYNLYKEGMSVAKYLAAGGTRADLRWDAAQGFVKIK